MANQPARLARALLVAFGMAACATVAHGQAPSTDAAGMPRRLAISNKPWMGDFEKMLERRMIRIYAPYSRSLYFNDRGRERGLAVELVRDWERYLNAKGRDARQRRRDGPRWRAAPRQKKARHMSAGLSGRGR